MTGEVKAWKAARAATAGTRAPGVFPADAPPGGTVTSLLGVDYIHLKTSDEGDLYLTRFGALVWRHLLLENWFAPEWFEAERKRLSGTGTVYRLPTRPVNGRSLNLVVKWSRVGEDVPLDTLTVNKFINAEFNSPFEEFSLLMELRQGELGPSGIHIRTQLPLAIYVPGKRLQLWQTGRSEHKIRAKIAQHPGVEIDILRQYVLLFGWIKGLDAVEDGRALRVQRTAERGVSGAGDGAGDARIAAEGLPRHRHEAGAHHSAANAERAVVAGPARAACLRAGGL